MTDAEVTEEDSEQSEIVHAIRRIMKAEEAILQDDPADHLVTDEAQQRIFAALDRLTGGGEDNPPTVLEAVIFERLDPLLRDWIDRYLPVWWSVWCAKKSIGACQLTHHKTGRTLRLKTTRNDGLPGAHT